MRTYVTSELATRYGLVRRPNFEKNCIEGERKENLERVFVFCFWILMLGLDLEQ